MLPHWGTMYQTPGSDVTQYYCSDTEQTNYYSSLLMANAIFGIHVVSHWFDSVRTRTPDLLCKGASVLVSYLLVQKGGSSVGLTA